MPLEDSEIFQGVCQMYAGEPIEQIMEKYARARKLNARIEEFGDIRQREDGCQGSCDADSPESQLRKKRWSRRNLKFDPATAIDEDGIVCCLCGERRSVLTRNHLAKHGISSDEYRRICGYAPDVKLMSRKRVEQMKRVVLRAQEARRERTETAAG